MSEVTEGFIKIQSGSEILLPWQILKNFQVKYGKLPGIKCLRLSLGIQETFLHK